MNEQELLEIKERLERDEYINKMIRVPNHLGEPVSPFKQYQEDIRRLLGEVEKLQEERKLMLRDSVWERDERLKQDAEIERLEEVEKDLRNELSILNKERCEYYANSERLRKVLEEIAETPLMTRTVRSSSQYLAMIARKVLEESE